MKQTFRLHCYTTIDQKMSIYNTIARSLTYSKHSKLIAIFGTSKSLHKCRRYFSNNLQLCVKMYMEHENRYAYSILENKGYGLSLITEPVSTITKDQFQETLQIDWSKKTPSEVFKVFPNLGVYCAHNDLCISNTLFDEYIDILTDNITLATDKELESLFYSLNQWPETPSIRTRNYIEVWAALDDECLRRVRQQWSYEQILSFIALFYKINIMKVSDFCIKSLNKLASRVKQLTPGQVVQTLFFVGVVRIQPFDMHNLEVYVDKNFTYFSIDDLAIISMGFFKSKTPIRNMNLVSKISNVILENSKIIHEVSLAALLKIIRYSTKITLDDSIYQLLDKLQHEVPRLSVMCNVHLALLGTSTLTLHKKCLLYIAQHTIQHISNTRIKDLERLVLTYGTFNLIPNTKESFFTKVMDELRKPEREDEILKHGRSFACCVAYLSILGIYPTDLMSKVLSKDFLTITYGKQVHSYGREILVINNTAEIFCGNAEINHLDKRATVILAKKYTDFVPSEDYEKRYNITERMMLDVMKHLKDCRGGNDYVVADHILPHHQRGDIIICNDTSGKPLPVRDTISDTNFGLLKRPPDMNKWVVLVIAGRNSIVYGTNTPTGYFRMKINELRKLGFHAALVPWSIYSKYDKVDEKEEYLESLIINALKSVPS